jgi:hypothetical protein
MFITEKNNSKFHASAILFALSPRQKNHLK